MSEERISVVMPVHNAGAFLAEALDSLLGQTYQNYEIICVNDASEDVYTNDLLRKYEKKDPRISVIWQKENVGAGEARNIGFAKAGGSYVIFLDADDIFNSNMLEQMYRKIREEDGDVCLCGYKEFYMEQTEKIFLSEKRPEIYNKKEDFFLTAMNNPWTKLCRTDYLKKHNIRFPSSLLLPPCEDIIYSGMVYTKSTKQCVCDGFFVEYRRSGIQLTASWDYSRYFRSMNLLLGMLEDAWAERQLLVAVMVNGLGFIEKENDGLKKAQYYENIKKMILENENITYEAKIFNYYYDYIMYHEYDEEWCGQALSYSIQLEAYRADILDRLKDCRRILLWGNGKRGEAFQEFCVENRLHLIGVADSSNENTEGTTPYGTPVINVENTEGKWDMIVACNDKVYEFLQRKGNAPLMNLQDYCPLR